MEAIITVLAIYFSDCPRGAKTDICYTVEQIVEIDEQEYYQNYTCNRVNGRCVFNYDLLVDPD